MKRQQLPFGDHQIGQADQGIPGSRAYSEAVRFDLRYPGQVWDEETGLAYNLHRHYDAQLGRYVQNDPIGLDGGWNRFGYVNGNPLSRIDPNGQFGIDGAVAGGIIGGIQGGLGAALAGGNGWDIWSGAAAGTVAGGIAGGIGGGATGAVAGGIGDLAGQVIANRNNGKPLLSCVNVGEVAGATLGGFVGGKGADFLAQGLSRYGAVAASSVAGTLASDPGLGLTIVGNKLNGESQSCGCN